MAETEPENVIGAIRSSRPPDGMVTRIVAIDGPGGAGKSSLAECLARELGAPIVHTDDFASPENPLASSAELIGRVLAPLAAHRSARYTPASWGGREKEQVVIEPAEFVLLEGVTASREAFRRYLAYSIWIDTPREARLRRGLQRDGEGASADWERWMAEEDAYVARERPEDHADLILDGTGR